MSAPGVAMPLAEDAALMQQALVALEKARTAIEPLTGKQIELHRLDRRTPDLIEEAMSALRERLALGVPSTDGSQHG